jgi:nifR3 family TIM-barrel protein
VSEFVAAEGLSRDNAKTLSMLRFLENERPVSIQIFGADVDRMVRAAEMVEEAGADIVDVNCGCPAPKVVRRGGGAALMKEPRRLAEVLGAIRRAVSIPMTVKLRAGWDEECSNAVAIARLAEAEGAAMVAVHGRTRVQLYNGEADWDLVAAIRETLSVPVIGSGDISTVEAARERLEGGYSDGIMIGRAALDNPWIFGQISTCLEGAAPRAPRPQERVAALMYFRDALRETLPDRAFMGRYRGLACRLVKGALGSSAVRRTIGGARSVEEVDNLVSDFLLPADQRPVTLEEVA